jgi:uncharacterized repeat protein (TIGR03803 family)
MRLTNVLAILTLSTAFTAYAAGEPPVAVHTFLCQGAEGEGRCPKGGAPTSIIQGSDGNFYGTASQTIQQAERAGGLVFSLTPQGHFTVLYKFIAGKDQNFPAGQDPAQLVEGSDGMLYGTTQLGGVNDLGTVFRLNRDGSGFRVIHSFCDDCGDGYDPLGMTASANGVVYGATFYSGSSNCECGTIFSVDTATGTYKFLKQTERAPSNPLAGSNGMVYWTVVGDLFIYNQSTGNIQRINLKLPKGLINFPGTASSLVFGANGNLYGIYGAAGKGSGLFEIQPNGSNRVLFPMIPNFIQGTTSGLVLGGDGNLWLEQSQANAGYGEIQTVSPSTGKLLHTLKPFSQTSPVGGYPNDLISAQNGSLWGVTLLFGKSPSQFDSAEGVVFSIAPKD